MKDHIYFITGGCGFLGQYIVKAVRDYDPRGEIRVLDLQPRCTLLGIEFMPGVKLLSGDLRQPETFAKGLAGVDTVIHSAGLISFKKGDEEILRQSNIVGMQNLLQAALDHQCRQFIFISSISAIGCQPGQISDETMIPDLEKKRLSDPYGYSKRMGELALQAKADYIRAIILNPSIILGPGSRRIARIVSLLRWVPLCPMITTYNSFVDVRDVAKAVVLALDKGHSGERYIVTAQNLNMLTFMRLVLAGMGKNVPVFPAPASLLVLYDALVSLLDLLQINPGLKKSSGFYVEKAYSYKKIRLEMGWEPTYILDQTLRDMLLAHSPGGKHESVRQNHIAYRRF